MVSSEPRFCEGMMTLLVLDLTHGIICNCSSASGACTPLGPVAELQYMGEWGCGVARKVGFTQRFSNEFKSHHIKPRYIVQQKTKIHELIKIKLGRTTLALICTALSHLLPEVLRAGSLGGLEHQEIADFEL